MVAPSHTAKAQPSRGWFPSGRALWSLSWRLSILLIFFLSSFVCALFDWWWAVLGCILGFTAAAYLIRRLSTIDPEPEASSGDHIVFL
jgi:hypothetical protein